MLGQKREENASFYDVADGNKQVLRYFIDEEREETWVTEEDRGAQGGFTGPWPYGDQKEVGF